MLRCWLSYGAALPLSFTLFVFPLIHSEFDWEDGLGVGQDGVEWFVYLAF